MPDDSESNALVAEARLAQINSLGYHHEERRKTLGNRLNTWYKITAFWVLATFVAYFCLNGIYFDHLAKSLASSLGDLTGNKHFTPAQVLILFYTSKLGLLAIFLIPLVWALKRISHMQALRSIHADKAILANTLQAILYSNIEDIKKPAWEIGLKEIFSSSCEMPKRRAKRKDNITDLTDLETLKAIKELLGK